MPDRDERAERAARAARDSALYACTTDEEVSAMRDAIAEAYAPLHERLADLDERNADLYSQLQEMTTRASSLSRHVDMRDAAIEKDRAELARVTEERDIWKSKREHIEKSLMDERDLWRRSSLRLERQSVVLVEERDRLREVLEYLCKCVDDPCFSGPPLMFTIAQKARVALGREAPTEPARTDKP